MLSSRHFHDENAVVSRTPHTSKGVVHGSPHKRVHNTASKGMYSDKKPGFRGQSTTMTQKQKKIDVSPKKSGSRLPKTPARPALGEKTNQNTATCLRHGLNEDSEDNHSHHNGSISKKDMWGAAQFLKGEGNSPLKNSPTKSGNGATKQKKRLGSPQKNSASIQQVFGAGHTLAENSSGTGMSTHSKNLSPRGDGLAQQSKSSLDKNEPNAFTTPAANTGEAGKWKFRIAEIMDDERLASGGVSEMVRPENEVHNGETGVELRHTLDEEELYPEIEYMPPSDSVHLSKAELPPELEGLPRADEIGSVLKNSRFMGFVPTDQEKLIPEMVTFDTEEDLKWQKEFSEKFHIELDSREGIGGLWSDVEEEVEVRGKTTAPQLSSASTHSNNGSRPKSSYANNPTVSVSQRRKNLASNAITSSSHPFSTTSTSKMSNGTKPLAKNATLGSTHTVSRGATSKPGGNPRVPNTIRNTNHQNQVMSAVERPSYASRQARQLPVAHTSNNHGSMNPSATKLSSTTTVQSSAKPPAKTIGRAKMMNPALRNLHDDALGKQIDTNLKELDNDPEITALVCQEGFMLDDNTEKA